MSIPSQHDANINYKMPRRNAGLLIQILNIVQTRMQLKDLNHSVCS